MKFGLYLIEQGEISAEQLVRAMKLQQEARPSLGQLAMEEGLISAREVLSILRVQSDYAKERFGETAIDMGLLSRRDVAALLLTQSDRQPPLEQALVQIGAIDSDRCKAALLEYREELERQAKGGVVEKRVRHMTVPAGEHASAGHASPAT